MPTFLIGRVGLILIAVLMVFPVFLAHTASSQQLTTVTLGSTTTTWVSLSNTTIVSLSNTTGTIVQTITVTSQVARTSLSNTRITITDTLVLVNVTKVEAPFLQANAGWLLPPLVFAVVFAVLLVAGRVVRIEK